MSNVAGMTENGLKERIKQAGREWCHYRFKWRTCRKRLEMTDT